jgi:hypothetical protein
MALIRKYLELKRQDAVNPAPRQNTLYVPGGPSRVSSSPPL